MSTRNRQVRVSSTSASDETVAVLGLVLAAVTVLAVGWVSLHLAARLHGDRAPANNPVQLLVDVATKRTSWSITATVVAVLLVALVVAGVVGGWRLASRHGKNDVDRAARYLASPRDVSHLTGKGAVKKSQRLGVGAVEGTLPGVPCGRMVPGGAQILTSWEDMTVLVAGPRTFKSTAYAIPSILAAPGPVLATSNKRDIVDATRGIREKFGRVWILDPQRIARSEPTWWWNPLTYVAPFDPTTGAARRDGGGRVQADFAQAQRLAEQFVASTRPAHSTGDDYFGPTATDLIALLLLAAACGDRPITAVYEWLTTPHDDTPVDLLGEHGFGLQEKSLYALAHLADKQRDGVYGTAQSRVGFLRDPNMTVWITPPANPARRLEQFHPSTYARTRDTLYPLSKAGDGGAGPIVAALTVAVLDALQEEASGLPGGRLSVPFLGVLDEAANICRVRDLDSYYSFFGSLGIVLVTILQSWAQGEDVWGQRGMEKLWSAANMKIYGGGVDDDRFLRRVSDLIGPYDRMMSSRSSGRGGSSRSTQTQERPILTVAQLRELKARAIAFPSGTPAVLLKPQPWFTGPDRQRISASISTYGPDARPLVADLGTGRGA